MNRPQWTKEKVQQILSQEFQKQGRVQPQVVLIGVRGFFQDSMGVVDQNDRGIYDDAVFLVSPTYFTSFNFNADPSRSGKNPDTGKGYAVLTPGIWNYKVGIHGLSKPKEQQYTALTQAAEVVIHRDGATGNEKGFFGINIHRGGNTGTSSLGCQTVLPVQWNEFISAVKSELKKYNQSTIPYVLIESQG